MNNKEHKLGLPLEYQQMPEYFDVHNITGLWTNSDLNGPVGEPALAPNSDKLQSNPDY